MVLALGKRRGEQASCLLPLGDVLALPTYLELVMVLLMLALLNRLRSFDRRRPSFPGEHLLVATTGLAVARSAMRRRTTTGRALALVAAAALLYRAASGRDGLARLMDRAR